MVSIENVLAISNGLALVCEVNGRRVGVPPHQIDSRSEVKNPGDRGRLVIPEQVAVDLGLTAESMMDDSERVELTDVYVLSADRFVVTCCVGGRVVPVRASALLPGTEVAVAEDRGRLVLTREEAVSFGLA